MAALQADGGPGLLVRGQRLPGGCHAGPGDHATAAPPGPADSAARTATAGMPPATGATGSGAQSEASSAALRPLRGRNSWCWHRQDPLLSSGAITQRECSAIFRERDDAISPFPRKSTPVLLESNVFPASSPYLATHRRAFSPPPTTFPAPFRAAPAASSRACPHLAIRLHGAGRAQGCGQEATI
jgi:hypothetical protein